MFNTKSIESNKNNITRVKRDLREVKDFLGIKTNHSYATSSCHFKDDSDFKMVVDYVKSKLAPNFFKDCPCCKGDEIIEKDKGKSFKVLKSYLRDGNRGGTFVLGHEVIEHISDKLSTEEESDKCYNVHYTTEESYETHENKIKEWEKEVEEYINNNN